MRHSAILVFANKQDLKDALSPAETCEAMGLPQMKARKWHVQVRWAQRARGQGEDRAVQQAAGLLEASRCHSAWPSLVWADSVTPACLPCSPVPDSRSAGRHRHSRRGSV